MGSLNGDIVVMRNGRTTSQVSIYNYPEHLNPFYEDDQHKRLRFWKISKKDNEGRRNSFSIGNLRDMWSFKTFRMKKKSSTLGINKTSESPPLLRRDYVLDNGWNTFDHRLRVSNTSSINGDSFQRNAAYRSSLNTLPTSNDRIGLNRNDGYRSTIQVPRANSRFQTLQKQQQQQLQQTMGVSYNRRSSQSSMASTNPFESDDDENEDINSISMRSAINGSTTTLTSRTPRKKRRAPAPPTPSHGRNNDAPIPIIRIEPSHDNTQDELCIKEGIDIANLTAEIESFVKTKSNDDVVVATKNEVQPPTTTATANLNGATNSSDEKELEKQIEGERDTTKIAAATRDISNNVFTTEDIDTSKKQAVNAAKKENGAFETVTTSATTTTIDAADPVKMVTKLTKVSNELVMNVDESKEIKINGAIPKNSTNNTINNSSTDRQQLQQQSPTVVTDLCIKEASAEELSQKPVPLKRQTKPEMELGHVECIHVHVESPRATPRKDHPNDLTSFKTNEKLQSTQPITTKTPFILTSPSTPRRNYRQKEHVEPILKETVKIIETTTVNERINELSIKEERISVKPEIPVKPALSPKQVTKEINGKIHGFAEIHKPKRRNNQNGHVRRTQEGSISPPLIPERETKNEEEEEKINNTSNLQTTAKIGVEKAETLRPKEFETINNLKIIETSTGGDDISHFQPIEEENVKGIKEISVVNNPNDASTVDHKKDIHKRDAEYEHLYRPKPASHMEWKRSTLAPLETNIPPEKRKSVKDIIESINRSQRLLNAAANKDFPLLQNQNADNGANTIYPSNVNNNNNSHINNNNINENLKILDERQEEMQSLIEDMTSQSPNTEKSSAAARCPSPSPSNCNNECTDAQELDNSEIFQKCKVKKEVYDYRETSPITSNLDWNPVPKPKRAKPAYE